MRKRKPSTHYALIQWDAGGYTIELKANAKRWNPETFSFKVLCDDQPLGVLKAMLKLFKEGTE